MLFSVESYKKWVQFYAKSPTDDFIVYTWGHLKSGRINDFLIVCKCGRLCVNFLVGTFQVDMHLWPKFLLNVFEYSLS